MKKEVIVKRKEIEKIWGSLTNKIPGVARTQVVPFITIKTYIDFKPDSDLADGLETTLFYKEKELCDKFNNELPNLRFEYIYI